MDREIGLGQISVVGTGGDCSEMEAHVIEQWCTLVHRGHLSIVGDGEFHWVSRRVPDEPYAVIATIRFVYPVCRRRMTEILRQYIGTHETDRHAKHCKHNAEGA